MQCPVCQAELTDDTVCPACSKRAIAAHTVSDMPPPFISLRENPTAAFADYSEYIPYVDNQLLTIATNPPARANIHSPSAMVASPQAIHPYQEVQKPSRTTSGIAVLALLITLLLVEGSGFVYFTTKLQPDMLHAQATTIAKNILANQRMQATATSSATNAMTPSEMYQQATAGIPTINDALDKPGDNLWFPIGNSQAQCKYANGSFHILLSIAGSYSCAALNSSFTAFAFQAQMMIINGEAGGLIFDETLSNGVFDGYVLECNYTGEYALLAITATNQSRLLTHGFTSALKQGYHQKNVLTVIVKNGEMLFYIGQNFVAQISDTTYASGHIALFGAGGTNQTDIAFNNVDIAFNNVKVWDLSQ